MAATTLVLGVVGILIRGINIGRMVGPTINADESGYLVNARAIAQGTASGHKDYFPGYSLLIAPVFRLSSDPVVQYRLVLAMSVVLTAFGGWLTWRILRRLVFGPARPWLPAVAAATTFLPLWLGYSLTATSELALNVGVLSTVLFLLRYIDDGDTRDLLASGFLAGIIVSIHPRAVVVPIALVLAGLVTLSRIRIGRSARANRYGAGACVAAIGGGLVLTLLSLLWIRSLRLSAGVKSHYGPSRGLSKILNSDDLFRLAPTISGQVAYQMLAAGLLFIVGVYSASVWAVHGSHGRLAHDRLDGPTKAPGEPDLSDDRRQFVALFLLLSLAGSLLVTGIWTVGLARGDAPLYGRYNDAFVLPLVVLGIATTAECWRSWRARTRVVLAIAPAVLMSALLFASLRLLGTKMYSGSTVWFNVPALTFLEYSDGRIDLSNACWAALVTGGAIAALLSTRPGLGLAVIAGAAILSAGYLASFPNAYVDASINRSTQRSIADLIRDRFPDEECVGYDSRSVMGWHLANYAFFLGETNLQLYDPSAGETPCGPLVISSDQHLDAISPAFEVVALENHVQQWLWVDTRAAQRRYPTFPGPPDAALPETALESAVGAAGPARSTVDGDSMSVVLPVTVCHRGDGSNWASRVGLRTEFGFVSFIWITYDGNGVEVDRGVSDLPETMLPDQCLTDEVLAAFGTTPAIAEIRVGLLQHGWVEFGEHVKFTLEETH